MEVLRADDSITSSWKFCPCRNLGNYAGNKKVKKSYKKNILKRVQFFQLKTKVKQMLNNAKQKCRVLCGVNVKKTKRENQLKDANNKNLENKKKRFHGHMNKKQREISNRIKALMKKLLDIQSSKDRQAKREKKAAKDKAKREKRAAKQRAKDVKNAAKAARKAKPGQKGKPSPKGKASPKGKVAPKGKAPVKGRAPVKGKGPVRRGPVRRAPVKGRAPVRGNVGGKPVRKVGRKVGGAKGRASNNGSKGKSNKKRQSLKSRAQRKSEKKSKKSCNTKLPEKKVTCINYVSGQVCTEEQGPFLNINFK